MVDVGGSVGSVVYTLIQENPHLRYVIQDIEHVVKVDAAQVCFLHSFGSQTTMTDHKLQYWDAKMPSAVADGRVQLQGMVVQLALILISLVDHLTELATNFFESQPVKNADVYFMRLVLHDWPDDKCQQILKILRGAAGSKSRLIVFDQIMTHACKYDGPFADVSNPIKAPSPLLANLGMGAGGFLTMIDLQVRFRVDVTTHTRLI